ncbi:hypothetical protein [uncultured Sphingomonas sp.]|uniref:type II toxin-antitoxin system death-on-curing family toxin n=1 Tax=uncultured Sphingomonas sp. TaxID=158754 RepID=UPI0025900109|nr:hypothetical protein [uncultured Sphingomonas sp.]
MSEPTWVGIDEVVALNHAIVTETGEDHGIVHVTKLEAAIHRPIQYHAYGPEDRRDDLVLLGVKLCVGVSESQGFIQGNKRTGLAAMEMFFNINGYAIAPTAQGDLADLILASAHPDKSIRLSDDDFADRLDIHVVERCSEILDGGFLAGRGVGKLSQTLREDRGPADRS